MIAMNKKSVFLFASVAAVACMYAFWRKQTEYRVHDKGIILITGASSGIGRFTAEYLASAHPSFLILAGVRKQNDFQSIQSLGVSNLQPLLVDVSNEDSMSSASESISQLCAQTGLPFTGLVNNAGLLFSHSAEFSPVSEARQLFETNVFGLLRLSQLLLPLLRASEGRLVFVSSVAGFLAQARLSLYSASKHAVEALADSLRRELGAFKVSVSLLQPGFVSTAIQGKAEVQQQIGISAEERAVYAHLYCAKSEARAQRKLGCAVGPEGSARALEHALFDAHPRTRYREAFVSPGLSAEMISWIMWVLPDRIKDIMLRNA